MGGSLKKHIVRISIGLVLVLLFLGHAAKQYSLPLVDRLEAVFYDTRLALTMPRTVDPRIVILDIDEKSLADQIEKLEVILGDLDGQLSLKNATIRVTV